MTRRQSRATIGIHWLASPTAAGDPLSRLAVVALRESVTPESVRSEVGRWRAVITGNVDHPESVPMIIGRGRIVSLGRIALTRRHEAPKLRAVS